MAKQRILVVDDEEDLLELISYNLSKEGYRVTTAASGEEAMREARSNPPDLIVLDLLLPSVDGLEVCKLLKSDTRTKHVPIVMLTAKGEEADVVSGLELGADDYITKPFSPRFRLLHFLAQRPGWAFSRTQIVDAVKGDDYPVTERSVDVQVAGLRKKLGTYGEYIETVRGVGYRFKE
jgi:two-component system alkaline phosphatase synthesis response regulator PhoP